MWNWLYCYLSGRHDYGVWCEQGAIFLRCVHCGRRSSGWAIEQRPVGAEVVRQRAQATNHAPRVLPFERAAAR